MSAIDAVALACIDLNRRRCPRSSAQANILHNQLKRLREGFVIGAAAFFELNLVVVESNFAEIVCVYLEAFNA